ncbi:MAG TPA: hypothetical protein VEU33_38795 [Archangium sp.]|nr:hypothetical protein [Archangium sp.]
MGGHAGLLTAPLFLQQDPGPGHPESPARLQRVLGVLDFIGSRAR